MGKTGILILGALGLFATPAYAHGGPVFAFMMILIWGVIPILVISLIVLPLTMLLGRLLHWRRKSAVMVGIGATLLLYLLCLPNMQAIMNWVVDLQYYFD